MEIPSNECLSKIQSLVSCPTKITVVRSFRGNQARAIINLLDRVSNPSVPVPQQLKSRRETQVLERSCLDDKLQQRCLRLLSKICKASGFIPVSYFLCEESVHLGVVRYCGGYADVNEGKYMGFPVAIKRLRIKEGDSDNIFKVHSINLAYCCHSFFVQRLCRETIAWKYLSHPNILPLKGIYVSVDPTRFCILSEWMPNGNVMEYTRLNPEANRLRLVSHLSFSPISPFFIHQ